MKRKRQRIALGVTSFNRPEMLEKCLRSIAQNLDSAIDLLIVHDDSSDPRHAGALKRAYKRVPNAVLQLDQSNKGVACAKNDIFRHALVERADWVFIAEDDLIVKNLWAITGYLEACKESGLPHLAWAHHGSANVGGPVERGEYVSYYPHSIGSWCCYSAEVLQAVGLFDERMFNAFEHVEWEVRAFRAGYMPDCGPHRFPDATDSPEWLVEQPHSIEKSSIRPRSDWSQNIHDSLQYWRDEKRETFDLMFGEGTYLHDYAKRILS